MIKKLIITSLIFFISIIHLKSQNKLTLSSLISPAPNAAELGKYGSYPVGMLTGIPEISFPLYEIKSGKLSLPITLSYHSSGIQVSQTATDVGLGWSVMAGGTLSRTVYGTPDDAAYGYFNSSYTPFSLSALQNMRNFDTLQRCTLHPGYDLEPDLFCYNIGGKSGKFIYTKGKSFSTIPFEPIKISISKDGQQNIIFQIIDDNGTIYNFTKYNQSITTYDSRVDKTISSWYLTSMISADLVDTISFSYNTQPFEESIEQQTFSIGQIMGTCSSPAKYIGNPNQGNGIDKNYVTSAHNELLVSQINFRGGYIQFKRTQVRKDTYMQSYSLDSMLIYNNCNSCIKAIAFNHGYYLASNFYNAWMYYRLQLTGYQESDSTGSMYKKYQFGYDSTSLPYYGSYNMDYWGYYNGSNNTSLIPVTTVYDNTFNTTSFNDGMSYINDLFTSSANAITFGTANREPSAAYMKAGVLNQVTYPTGGYTTFEFEPHQYLSDNYVTINKNSGGTTVGVTKYIKSQNTYSFTYPADNTTSNINNYAVANLTITFSPSNIGNTVVDDTQKVTLTDLTTNVTQTWTHTGDLTQLYTVNTNYTLYNNHSYTLTCTVYGDNSVTLNTNLAWTENAIQHPIKIGGGLRVKTIKSYYSDGTLQKEEDYAYGVSENGLGVKLFDENTFYKNYEDNAIKHLIPATQYANGSGDVGNCIPFADYWKRNYMGLTKYNSLNYLGSPILYSSVTKYEGTSQNNSGKTVYNYNIPIDNTFIPNDFINASNYGSISNAWNIGNLTDQTAYKLLNGQFIPVKKMLYEYGQFNIIQETAIQIKQYKTLFQSCACTGAVEKNFLSPNMGVGYFSFFQYPITTGANRLIRETIIDYDQQNTNNTITSVKVNQYQNPLNFYVTQINSTKSNGVTNIIRYKYPQDYTDAISQAMVSKNILTPVIDQKNSVLSNGLETLLSTIHNNYMQINNLIALDSIQYSTGTNPLETRIKFNRYDIYGNIIEQQMSNNIREVYLWGYNNQYPVAKIIGSDSATVSGIINNQSLLNNPANDYTMRNYLNSLRTSLSNALVYTYTYKPLVGMTSQTEPTGKTMYYDYDGFNHLRLIRDQDNNIIKKFAYDYAGQPENLTDNVFTSTKSQAFTKNNCTTGNGSSVTYTTTATSSISQTDADNKAQNDINANGQNYANTNGTCNVAFTVINPTSTPFNFSFTNVATGAVTTFAVYPSASGVQNTIPVGTYNISVTQMYPSSNSFTLSYNGTTQTGTSFTLTNFAFNASMGFVIAASSGGSSCSGACIISMNAGFVSPTNGVSCSGTSISGYLVVYSTSVMKVGTAYYVGNIGSSCAPSATRSFSATALGDTFNITVYTSGAIYVTMTMGTALNPNIAFSINPFSYSK